MRDWYSIVKIEGYCIDWLLRVEIALGNVICVQNLIWTNSLILLMEKGFLWKSFWNNGTKLNHFCSLMIWEIIRNCFWKETNHLLKILIKMKLKNTLLLVIESLNPRNCRDGIQSTKRETEKVWLILGTLLNLRRKYSKRIMLIRAFR